MLSLNVIQQYPKLSILVYNTLIEFMPIFDNGLVSIFQQCLREGLIEDSNAAILSNQKYLQKRVKVNECASKSRENLLQFYTKDYVKNLNFLCLQRAKATQSHDDGGIVSKQ